MWLLAAAIPVQGMAAVTMFACGPGHHRMAQDHEHAMASGAAHQHPAAGTDGHHHDAVASASAGLSNAAHAGVDGHATSADSRLHKVGKVTCSACASCCTAAAMPASILTFDASVPADLPVPHLYSTVPVFLTDGPERPPRFLLA